MKFDVHCYVGHWPFRDIPYRSPDDIRQLMARTGTQKALLTPMAALFYKDCLSAVRALCDELADGSESDLLPVAVVNPAFPGWQDDLAIMLDELGCVAVRLFPNYHSFRLTDPQAEALLSALQERGVPVLLAPRIEDERLHHWLARIPPVSSLDFTWVLRAFPALKIVLCQLKPDEVDQLATSIIAHSSACVDTSARMPQFYMEAMIHLLGADRVVFGTGAPLQYPECAVQLLEDAGISETDRDRIYVRNAAQLFDIQVGEGVGQ